MSLMKDTRGFIDMDIVSSPGFIILVLMAVGATLIGFIGGPRWMELDPWPIWQLLVIIIVEVGAAYVIVARG